MGISEEQLATWCKQGPTAQFTSTYETIKGVLNDVSSPFYTRNFSIFLQGSYKNDSNVYGDSDVDVVIRLEDIFYTDLDQLPADDVAAYKAARSDASYSLGEFKADVVSWLTKKYKSDVQPGNKAVFIKGNGNRRNADVLICAKLRRYHSYKSSQNNSYTEGICFFRSDGTQIDNFPIQHSDNCTTKHQATNSWFKRTVRIYKNLRNTLIENDLITDDIAPSYFIEGLLWNVPADRFGGTQEQNFYDVIKWLNDADRSKFLCANKMYYLFHPTSPVTWRAENCENFLKAAIEYWNDS